MFFQKDNNAIASKVDWKPITDISQIEDILKNSTEIPVLIFKHSTRCGISRMVLKEFEQTFDLHDKVVSYYLDLLTYREISNQIADIFGITHQSPQILVIKNGVCVYDASHSDVLSGRLGQVL